MALQGKGEKPEVICMHVLYLLPSNALHYAGTLLAKKTSPNEDHQSCAVRVVTQSEPLLQIPY